MKLETHHTENTRPNGDDRESILTGIYPEFDSDGGVRLGTLVAIRWIGVSGQLFALALVAWVLEFDVKAEITVPLVLVSALLNLWFSLRSDKNKRLPDSQARAHLAFDLVHVAALLFATGGLSNPFCMLMLVPTTVSATMLTRQSTYGLIALSLILATTLAFTPYPLPWNGAPPVVEPLFLTAIWISLCFTLVFLAVYMARVGRESRIRAKALVATQLALEQEQKLAALGALAAAAAHELGTPMGTIMLAAKDLLNSWQGDTETRADLELILSEITRCRNILSELREQKKAGLGEHFALMPVAAILREAAAPHEQRGIKLEFNIGAQANFEIARTPEIIHSIRSIVENAVGFARNQVVVAADRSDDVLMITIDDDGPGFDPQIVRNLGEPYVTTRRPRPGRDGGLGLGLFIAKSLLERMGASLSFGATPKGGARTSILFPQTQSFDSDQTSNLSKK